ncbi:MAG: lysylphosphatidylglycerol synthase transmembrane domain-containing protein [Candidatus Omnitrophota bacterium]
MRKKTVFGLFRIFISLFLLGLLFLIMRGKMGNLIQVIQGVNVQLFFLAMLFIVPIVFISGLRLQCFLTVQGLSFKLSETIRLSLIGYFFNNFMPSTVGGDVAKVYYARKRSGDYTRPFSAVLIDRLAGLSALIVLAGIAVIIWGNLIQNKAAKIIILLGFFLLLSALGLIYTSAAKDKFGWLFKSPLLLKIREKTLKIYKAINLYRRSKTLLIGFGLSFLSHVLFAVYAYGLAKSLDIDLPISIFFILIPVVWLISSLPSLNGLGIREGAFVYFFKEFIPPEQALALSILYFAQMICLSCIGGLVYLLNGAEMVKEVTDD